MKQDELDLLHDYFNGTISDADFARLQALLRESAEARRTLRGLATVDAKLQELGALNARTMELLVMPPPSPIRPRHNLLAWSSIAAAAACVVLALTGMLLSRGKSPRPRTDVAATISSTQEAIARLSIDLPPSFPEWASVTASMLDQPRLPQ